MLFRSVSQSRYTTLDKKYIPDGFLPIAEDAKEKSGTVKERSTAWVKKCLQLLEPESGKLRYVSPSMQLTKEQTKDFPCGYYQLLTPLAKLVLQYTLAQEHAKTDIPQWSESNSFGSRKIGNVVYIAASTYITNARHATIFALVYDQEYCRIAFTTGVQYSQNPLTLPATKFVEKSNASLALPAKLDKKYPAVHLAIGKLQQKRVYDTPVHVAMYGTPAKNSITSKGLKTTTSPFFKPAVVGATSFPYPIHLIQSG